MKLWFVVSYFDFDVTFLLLKRRLCFKLYKTIIYNIHDYNFILPEKLVGNLQTKVHRGKEKLLKQKSLEKTNKTFTI